MDASAISSLLKARGQQNDPASSFIWKNGAPPRVQMFLRLLMKGRIQCRSDLYHKKIVDSSECIACGAHEETPEHLIFQCPMAALFWEKIGMPLADGLQTRDLHCFSKVRGIPDDQHNAFISLCCWQIWKRRNALVFRQQNLNLRQLLLSCKAEANLWRTRLPKKSKKVIDDWCNLFELSHKCNSLFSVGLLVHLLEKVCKNPL